MERDDGSASGDDDFFSVARTIPFVAEVRQYDRRAAASAAATGRGSPLMPRAVTPWLTAFRAYSTERSTGQRGPHGRRGGREQRRGQDDNEMAATYQSAPAFRCRTGQLPHSGAAASRKVSLPGGEGGQREGVSVCHGCCWSRIPERESWDAGARGGEGGVDAAWWRCRRRRRCLGGGRWWELGGRRG